MQMDSIICMCMYCMYVCMDGSYLNTIERKREGREKVGVSIL
jgi:hypothetical protein